jgi:hypothetical protein
MVPVILFECDLPLLPPHDKRDRTILADVVAVHHQGPLFRARPAVLFRVINLLKRELRVAVTKYVIGKVEIITPDWASTYVVPTPT